MGLIAQPPTMLHEDPARLVYTPHPVLLDGQQHIVAELRPGETLGPYLARVVPDWTGDAWEVRINGVLVPHEVMDRVRPKPGTLIEVRGIVGKQVLAIIAIAVLAYFTMGAGLAAYGAAVGVTSAMGLAVLGAATFAAGSALINKVLMPKPKQPKQAEQAQVYSINSARNGPRPYEPIPLLLGSMYITPDVASYPYSWYEGSDQYMGMVLCAGINVHTIEAIYNGETLLSSYQGVVVYKNGLSGEADQAIPLYSNADTVAGGDLPDTAAWVQRTTSPDTIRIQVNLEYLLGGQGTSGKYYAVSDQVQVEYSPAGANTWTSLVSRTFRNNNFDQKRATLSADVAAGQYDVRVRLMGYANYTGANTQRNDFTWVTMTCVQADAATYAGIARIGLRIKATGQLNGALDELRCVAHAAPIPVWNGTAWVTEASSNPGAILLKYARGYFDEDDRIIAGMGLPDAQIDIPALQAFMVHCAANGYTYDNYIKDARSHQDLTDAIALAGFGQITWAAGKFSVAWAADGQPLTATVNMATIKRASFQVDYTLANAADGIEYTYIDKSDWKAKTLRVVVPGVTTMLNPATITGEGIGSEAHAAEMARYHLAQNLYQYKDISFSTDLEHLSYRRLSLLALQHDMTQWGYGGRVAGASVDGGGIVTVVLDEPVPAPPSGTAYIGLRIPGEAVYRVFPVVSFAGTTDTLTLSGTWPAGVAFPGDADENPAHDTIWIYDFKSTPGYRVRVVAIDPESDLQGARITVVPESDEFWTYVKTGDYTPPPNASLLPTTPAVDNLAVSEAMVYSGTGATIELSCVFDLIGPVAYSVVTLEQLLAVGEWADPVNVAETATNTARFSVPTAGTYRVTVRPFNALGNVGVVDSVEFTTSGADPAAAPTNLRAQSVSDAVLLTWDAVAGINVEYIIERSDNATGPWEFIARTFDLRYVSAEPSGDGKWYRVRADHLGVAGLYAGPIYGVPVIANFGAVIKDLIIGAAARPRVTESGTAFRITEDGKRRVTEGGVPGEVVVDCRYSKFRLLLDQDVLSWKFVNVTQTHELVFEIQQMADFTIAFPSSVVPVSGLPYQPTPVAGAVDVIRIITFDGGLSWRLIVGQGSVPDDNGGAGAMSVNLAPNPAAASSHTDGVTPSAPSVQVVATVSGGTGVITHAWTRADGGSTAGFLIDDATVANPTFSIASGLTAFSESQQWRDTVTDGDGRVVQQVVAVALSRSVGVLIAADDVSEVEESTGWPVSVSGFSTAVPSFGTGPYTYQWTKVSGGYGVDPLVAGAATASTATFKRTAKYLDATWIYRVAVTDVPTGTSHSRDITVHLQIDLTI